jgi:hypothetical protein
MVDGIVSANTRFGIGTVLSTTFSVLMRNIVTFAAITAIIGIPYIALIIWGASHAASLVAAVKAGHFPPGFFAAVGGFALVFTLTSVFVQAAINYGTFQDLRGQKADLVDCLMRGLSALPKIVIAGILAALAFMIGFMLLLVPGVILLVMWWVFVPAIVIEGAGITGCFGRSRELTRGRRWSIFGLLLIGYVGNWAIDKVTQLIAPILGLAGSTILSVIVSLAVLAFFGVMTSVGYFYLRAEKEGTAIGDIAAVFD